jgi:putative toxin-antitoxin system antitoxin component (TIGR02293 family)
MDHPALKRIHRIVNRACLVFDNPVKAMRWLSKPHYVFAGRCPVDVVAESESGYRDVEEELARIEYGIYV